MTQVSNQFAQTPEAGQLDLSYGNNVLTCIVSANEGGTLVPAEGVLPSDEASPLPKILGSNADTDKLYGFVVRNPKNSTYVLNDVLEIAQVGSVMYMTAGAAIAAGAAVEYDYDNKRVITAAGTNPVSGQAIDKAAAAADLIRVRIMVPSIVALTT